MIYKNTNDNEVGTNQKHTKLTLTLTSALIHTVLAHTIYEVPMYYFSKIDDGCTIIVYNKNQEVNKHINHFLLLILTIFHQILINCPSTFL